MLRRKDEMPNKAVCPFIGAAGILTLEHGRRALHTAYGSFHYMTGDEEMRDGQTMRNDREDGYLFSALASKLRVIITYSAP